LANNLANVNTIGFKRQLALFAARPAEAVDEGLAQAGDGSINDLGGGVRVLTSPTDFSPGPLNTTGGASDLAIDGDSFFVVSKHGEPMLTRAGAFMFNQNGVLVDPTGDPVLSESNQPIQIDPEGGPWQFTPDGGVAQAGDLTYLAMVRPRSPGDLVKHGENMFRPLATPVATALEDRHVLTGQLEVSGVEPTTEMVELIETTRAFEANVSVIRNYDQMMSTLVDRVLKQS
jgi:flagellar basal-body rod protein FlgF/flagellar basal-body rod protein FlgG